MCGQIGGTPFVGSPCPPPVLPAVSKGTNATQNFSSVRDIGGVTAINGFCRSASGVSLKWIWQEAEELSPVGFQTCLVQTSRHSFGYQRMPLLFASCGAAGNAHSAGPGERSHQGNPATNNPMGDKTPCAGKLGSLLPVPAASASRTQGEKPCA